MSTSSVVSAGAKVHPWRVPGRMAYVVSYAYPYANHGYAVRTHGVATALQQHGHSVIVISRPGRPWDLAGFDDPAFPLHHEIDGVRYLTLREPSARGLTSEAWQEAAAGALEATLRVFKPSAVMAASNWENALPALKAARALGVPFFYEVRGFWEITRISREPVWEQSPEYRHAVERETWVAQQADQVFTLNGLMCDELVRRGVAAERIELVSNGVSGLPDLARPARLTRDDLRIKSRYVVGYVGSFNPYEGLDDLIRAGAQLVRSGTDLSILLVGSGSASGLTNNACLETNRYRQLGDELELADRLVMPGRVTADQIEDYYSLIDLVVIPRKPLPVAELVSPIKPLEAAGHGKALLLSDVAPLAEFAQGFGAGLFRKGDAAHLAEQMRTLLNDDTSRQTMGAQARTWVETQRQFYTTVEPITLNFRRLSFFDPDHHPTALSGAHHSSRISTANRLRVAAIMDEFTYHCFAPECELLQLRADAWKQQVSEFMPDLLFIESAWRGADDTWQRKISDPSEELNELIDWAMDAKVPSAFWSKEDPVHFARFLPVARRVSHVFTTDIDCISRYKDALKHDRVYLLPFAAQPAMHNPTETVGRQDIFSFAGSWYPHYPNRQTDFRTLVGVGRKLKALEIYDRNADRPPPHDFIFPEEFQGEIRGKLQYTEMDRAYKGCRYGITVNTIKQSQTMFARRALELMACNTVVVSNFSKGLRLLFGDHVIASDSAAELEHRLAPLCSDEGLYRRHRLRALRKILAEHTYEHRFAYVASKVLERTYRTSQPSVAMLAEPVAAREAATLLAALERQTWPNATLILVATPGLVDHPSVEIVPDRRAALARLADFDYVAPLSAADYYGPDYLIDLALATRYAKGDGLTKSSFFAPVSGEVHLKGDGQQYRAVVSAALRRSLLRPALLSGWVADHAADIETLVIESATLQAIDEFSYCADAVMRPEVAARVDVEPLLRPGVSLPAQLQLRAEAIRAPEQTSDLAAPIVLSAKEWRRLLPKQIDSRLMLRSNDAETVEIESTLPTTEHQYLYFSRRFTPAELNAGNDTFFQMEANTRLDVRTVFVFDDEKQKKISHAMHTVGARHGLSVPARTASVRLALRIQGAGKATLGKLSLAEIRGLPTQILPSARHLVVANQYPSYEDLYRYGFVHARVRAYAQAGVPVEILRISADPHVVYREFEDIDVTQADTAHFEQCLAGGHYSTILVHIIDQRIWSVLRKYLDQVRVVIWAHGAEIQPWWRRAMNYTTDALRDQARRTSDARLAMWREIFSLHHPNLRVVFISRKQAGEALADLALSATSVNGIEIISNFINEDLFRYEVKDPALRHCLLSIRPFASPVYANDLTVQAILRLAREPFFDQLQVRIIGDGVLFDETVAPLKDMPNVQIERAFLTQRQIAALHRKYGVFLVPSRMDSQGVSRDEAMASGLVPITTRIAAIPEFVDDDCAFLTDPEDATALAEAVCRLHDDPVLFSRMSAAAAQRVRRQSSLSQTIARELALFVGNTAVLAPPRQDERLVTAETKATRLALYGDVNLNVMDGSAIWAASLAEVLGGISDVRVALVLKARIHRIQVIARLLDMAPAVQFIEPEIPERTGLTPAEAIARLVSLDARESFHGLILRGLDVCHKAAQEPALHGRLWAYLTDIPQQAELMDARTRERIETIIRASAFVLCQTPQMRDYFVRLFPQACEKARIVPPMIPPLPTPDVEVVAETPFRFSYAGKFAPRWGIRELFAAQKTLLAAEPSAELHVYGDKIHNPPDDPSFHPTVKQRLAAGEGLHWHGAVNRDELLRSLTGMHACWAYRDPVFERETLELSTKVLEYASLGLPMILARSQVFEALLGKHYPLFADTAEEAQNLLVQLAKEPVFRRAAAARLQQAAAQYTFAAVRERLITDDLIAAPVA